MNGGLIFAWGILLACGAQLLLPFGLNGWAQWRVRGTKRKRIALLAGWAALLAACGPLLLIAFSALRWHGRVPWVSALVYSFGAAGIATVLSLFCPKPVRSLLFLAGALSLLNTYLVGVFALG